METFRRGGVDIDKLSQLLPDEVEQMLYEMETILPNSITRLLNTCAKLSGDTDFGLHMNERVDITMYGIFGYLLLNSGTVKDLFETLVRYHTVHHNGGVLYQLNINEETVGIRLYYSEQSESNHRHITDWGLGFIPGFLHSSLGEQAAPLSTQFTHDAPEDLHRLKRCFGPNLEFNQARNQLIYPRSILNQRITDVDEHLLQILRERADLHLLALTKDNSLLNKIKAILIEEFGKSSGTANDVAYALNISISTLRRRMNREGIDFKQTKVTLKNDLAKRLLSETSAKIYEIALKTGFSNQSSFTRFFVQHNQQTPQAYRKSKERKR